MMNQTTLTPTACVQAACRGDIEAFNLLVLEHQERVFNQAYRILHEPQTAEDLTQDAFLAAYRKLNTYRGGSFKAWLLRIVTNLCVDHLRRQKNRYTLPLEPLNGDGEENDSAGWLADTGPLPEEAAEQTELGEAVHRCLENLHMQQRLAVILVDLQGLGYDEAAQAMNVPVGTLKSRLSRARGQLVKDLSGFRAG